MVNEEHFIPILVELMSLIVYLLHIFNKYGFFLQVAFDKDWDQA